MIKIIIPQKFQQTTGKCQIDKSLATETRWHFRNKTLNCSNFTYGNTLKQDKNILYKVPKMPRHILQHCKYSHNIKEYEQEFSKTEISPVLVVQRRIPGSPNQCLGLFPQEMVELSQVFQFVTVKFSVEFGGWYFRCCRVVSDVVLIIILRGTLFVAFVVAYVFHGWMRCEMKD